MLRKVAVALSVVFVAGILITAPAQAQTVSTLYSFKGGKDGQLPLAGVIRDQVGNLYGTTAYGGDFGWGVIFKLSPSGKETVLYSFTGKSDGATPDARLLRDKEGNFFGVTLGGGDPKCTAGTPPGCGVLFKFEATARKLVVLHTFKGPPSDGENPLGDLIRDEQGNFYGATTYGAGSSGSGAIFKLDTRGKETVLYSFTGGNGGPDGANPNGVIRDKAGNLYGTTTYGGAGNTGTVFKLDSSGNETILHTFAATTEGKQPMAGLVRDRSGNLYGTTNAGGAFFGGTAFKLDPSNKLTVLHSFGFTDGGSSAAPLILDEEGNLYGSSLGGTHGEGSLFKLDPSGNETVLYNFQGGKDGDSPVGTLLRCQGALYGVTAKGGAYDWGTVFKLTLDEDTADWDEEPCARD